MSINPHKPEGKRQNNNDALENFGERINALLGELKELKGKSSQDCLIKDETIQSITDIQTKVAEIQKSTASLQSLSDLDTKLQELSDCISALDIHTISDAIDGSYKDAVKNLTDDLNQIILQKLDEAIMSIKGQLDDINENMATQSSVSDLWDNHGLNDIFKRVNEIKNLLDKIDISSFQGRIDDSVNELEILVYKLQGSVGLTSDEYNTSSSENVKKIQEHITDKLTNATKPVSDKITSLSAKLNDIKKAIEEIQKNTKPSGSSVVHTSLYPEYKSYFTLTAIFAIALVLSAIFITRGYLVAFPNSALLTAALIFLCVSFGMICISNLVFSIKNIDLSSYGNKFGRLLYFVLCGIFVAVSFALSIAVLVI